MVMLSWDWQSWFGFGTRMELSLEHSYIDRVDLLIYIHHIEYKCTLYCTVMGGDDCDRMWEGKAGMQGQGG